MKPLLLKAIICGVVFEGVLAALFMLFTVGPCSAPLPGVVVLSVHYPAFFVGTYLLNLHSDVQILLAAPFIMAPIWIVCFYALFAVIASRMTPKLSRSTS